MDGIATDAREEVKYKTPNEQLEHFQVLNDQGVPGFSEDEIQQAAVSIPDFQDRGAIRRVLTIGLDAVGETASRLWGLLEESHPNSWLWEDFMFDEEHLRLANGASHKRGLSWAIVNLDANPKNTPSRFFKMSSLANERGGGPEILCAAIWFPDWFKTTRGLWLAGYEYHRPEGAGRTEMPLLVYDPDADKVKLGIDHDEYDVPNRNIPIVIG